MAKAQLRVRRSLQDIYNDFKSGKDTATLEKLMVAWQFIKALPATDPNSFMTLGGFHGEPFVGRGAYDGGYWGGYCNHGNILFPTWHRVYLHKLEKALQSVPGCESVMLPYWDQTYKITKDDGTLTFLGVPSILTDEYFTFSDGATIPNPLKSFVIPMALQDDTEVNFYSKPSGYETVRYPLSGLVGRELDRINSELNNSAYYVPGTNIIDTKLTASLLNNNIIGWLTGSLEIPDNFDPTQPLTPVSKFRGGVYESYVKCLDTPYYTVFSNNTSRNEWRKNFPDAQSLEAPHGSIHLGVGGVNVPGQDANPASPNPNVPADSNGDMGENETAGLDPIFFFHHCNVDRIFWMWQVKHNSTDNIDITVPDLPGKPSKVPYPGTNNINNQPPVGYEQTEQLTMDSPLYPFKLVENGSERHFRSSDVFNIETQLGLTYDNLSLNNTDGKPETLNAVAKVLKQSEPPHKSEKALSISGINRAKINGSFVVMAYATIDGTRHLLGIEPVLSRWKVAACKNCMTHLEVMATFPLFQFTEEEISNAIFEVQINGRKSNETEFAKFTVTNQANVNRFLSAKGAESLQKSALAATATAPKMHTASANGQSPFTLQVL